MQQWVRTKYKRRINAESSQKRVQTAAVGSCVDGKSQQKELARCVEENGLVQKHHKIDI